MEERREMNGQRMMTREELEMRLPALNHIAEQRDAKFRLRYAEKTLNNGIERGYTLDAGTRVSVNVYQNERWAQMPDEELFDTLNDLDGRYCVTEDQETIGERLNAFFKSGELFEKIYPVVVSENNMESFAKAGITFDRYLDMLITYRVELMQMNDGIGTIRLQDNHLETFGISRQKIRKAAFANLEGIVDFMTLRDDASGFKMIAVARKDKQFGGAAAMLLPSVRRRLAEIFGTRRALNDWWRRRAIPASRHQIQQLLDSLNLNSTLELAEENFGLSLSDRYWINDSKNPLKWEDVNFFDNDFTDDLGMLTLGQESSGNPNLMSPNSTLGGDLNKKWKIVNGKRFLVKGGTGSTRQEVLNEVVATALYDRLLSRNDYIPYFLFEEKGRIYSACENMLGQDEELVTAYDVLSTRKKPDSMSDYDFLVDTYKSLGLNNVEEGLAKMFTCDYILANQDRHWRNFGVIRNVETLEFTRLAPIFDNGTSLWCHAYNILAEDSYIAKPFGPKGMAPDKQLSLFRDYSWFDKGKLVGFPLEAKEILSHGNDGIQARLDVIESRIERNIGSVQRHIEKLAVGQKEPLRVKRDKVLQIPRMNDSVSRTERER